MRKLVIFIIALQVALILPLYVMFFYLHLDKIDLSLTNHHFDYLSFIAKDPTYYSIWIGMALMTFLIIQKDAISHTTGSSERI